MTLAEAKKIAAIVAKADGGCFHCVRHLCLALNSEFPEYSWTQADWYSLDERVEVEAKQ